jgi:hypothetical protein
VPLTFTSARVVKYWNGSTWAESQDFGNIKMWNGTTWQHVGIRPYADVPLVTFSPDGGTSGSPAYLSDLQYSTQATVTISASSSVVWTYTGGDGVNGYANFGSGGSGSSITFFAAYTGGYNNQQFNVSASTGATTKYWFIDLTSDSFA